MAIGAGSLADPGLDHRWNRLRRSSLILATVLLTLTGLEGALRLGAKVTLHERGQRFHPELGWHLVPNIRKVGRYWSSREPAWTNSRGWRDAESPFAKPPGVRRLVALGDSFTFGVSVDYGERFTEVLERTVPRLEAINLGVNAYGTDQELRVLELEGVRYHPDVVLLTVFLGNDLDDIRHERRFYWPRPHYELGGDHLRLVRPELTWDVRVRNATYLGEIGLRFVDRYIPADQRATCWRTADTVPLFLTLVHRMDAVSREHGAQFLTLVAGESPRPPDHDRVLAGLSQMGVPAIDLCDLFAPGAKARGLLAADGHWNGEGHRVVGEKIVRELHARGWLKR
jgi:lysophospholipase L1-like esterase